MTHRSGQKLTGRRLEGCNGREVSPERNTNEADSERGQETETGGLQNRQINPEHVGKEKCELHIIETAKQSLKIQGILYCPSHQR